MLWGNDAAGGNDRAAEAELQDVIQVETTFDGVACLLADGRVISWGRFRVPDESLENFSHVFNKLYATVSTFVAWRPDGSIFTWGDGRFGGTLPDELVGQPVDEVVGSGAALAALLPDRTCVMWGYSYRTESQHHRRIINVKKICASEKAFAVITSRGSVVTTGGDGSDISSIHHLLRSGGDEIVASNFGGFCALKRDTNELITWGTREGGSDSTPIQEMWKELHIEG